MVKTKKTTRTKINNLEGNRNSHKPHAFGRGKRVESRSGMDGLRLRLVLLEHEKKKRNETISSNNKQTKNDLICRRYRESKKKKSVSPGVVMYM